MELKEEVIHKACELAMKAHKSTQNPYIYEEISTSLSEEVTVFAFAGSWSVNDWFSQQPFGEMKINLDLFPFLQRIGKSDDIALVNGAFSCRFDTVLSTSSLVKEVEKAVLKRKKVVFVGHSSGGPIAIFATLWFLNKYTATCADTSPGCLTFGSLLVGDLIFQHALSRENWARFFIHFVMRYDIVPLMMLAPFSSIERELPQVLDFLNSESVQGNSVLRRSDASSFFNNVMVCASYVASHVASVTLMGCGTNLLANNFSSFIELSPYRPFGTYVFCDFNIMTVVVENAAAVLQMLFYFSPLRNEACEEVAYTRLKRHMVYEELLKGRINMQNVVYLDNTDRGVSDREKIQAFDALGLSRRGKLCFRAAEEIDKKRRENEENVNKELIKIELRKMQEYQKDCRRRKVGYYDAFKLQNDENDFKANTRRLVLAGIWDGIVDMSEKYKLPDGFEVNKEWINLGNQFRRLVEPIDIANYYRDGKNHDGGNYFGKGRPRRYKFPQRWLEHSERRPYEPISESCFMAEVEEIILSSHKKAFKDLEGRIVKLERQILEWDKAKVLGKDVFLENSTFSIWWNSLPENHKLGSCIKELLFNFK